MLNMVCEVKLKLYIFHYVFREKKLSITLNSDNIPCGLWVRHSIPGPQRHLGELGSSRELNITGQSLPSTAGHSTADACPPKEIKSRVKC